MKVMIVITGLTCSGKTYMTFKIKEKCHCHTIHTDSFYLPENGDSPNSIVGVDDEEKRKYFTIHKEMIKGDILIIEGTHAGNRKELELYKKYLDFNGLILVYEAKSSEENFTKWFIEKYKTLEKMPKLVSWYNQIYDTEPIMTVSSYEEIEADLKEKGVI